MAGWVITLIGSVAVYVFLMTYLFPQILLKTGLIIPTPRDRGIKNIKETTGRTIVYQPAIEYRKYIPQYLISERNGKKILLCKVSPNVKYIDYDVVMYDGTNQVCKVVNAKELIENDMYTEKMTLGANVAYVSIIINAVNNGMPADQTIYDQVFIVGLKGLVIQAKTVVVATGSHFAEEAEGLELTNDDVWISQGALAEGHTFEAETDGAQVGVGWSENTLSSFVIYDEEGNDVTGNYNYWEALGILEIKKAS